jgi:hypothetical protein
MIRILLWCSSGRELVLTEDGPAIRLAVRRVAEFAAQRGEGGVRVLAADEAIALPPDAQLALAPRQALEHLAVWAGLDIDEDHLAGAAEELAREAALLAQA